MLVNVGRYISVCFSVRQIVTMLQFQTTWLHLPVRSSPQQVSESQKPTLVFILLYLYQPNCQNMYNLLNPNSVPNYTPQRHQIPIMKYFHGALFSEEIFTIKKRPKTKEEGVPIKISSNHIFCLWQLINQNRKKAL